VKVEASEGYSVIEFRWLKLARLEAKREEPWPYSYEGRSALYLFPQTVSPTLSGGLVAYGGWPLSVHKEEGELHPSVVVAERYFETATALDVVHPFYEPVVATNVKRRWQLRLDPGVKL